MSNILLVDDRAENLRALEAVVEPLGHRTLQARSGEEALACLLKEDIALILLDVMMPGLDGWRVAEQLLDDPLTTRIPIVFLTARAEFRDRAKGLDIGGVDYITKPFNPLELAPLVRDLLDRIDRGERDELRREKLADLRALMEE
jgi:CheY-like chemotaxis protein